jgi:hypothetical protein
MYVVALVSIPPGVPITFTYGGVKPGTVCRCIPWSETCKLCIWDCFCHHCDPGYWKRRPALEIAQEIREEAERRAVIEANKAERAAKKHKSSDK